MRSPRPTGITTAIRITVLAVVVFAIALVAPPARAQVNPPASAVNEEQLLAQLGRIDGRCTLPDRGTCTVEQPRGRDVATLQAILRWLGAVAIFGTLGVCILFGLFRGTVRIEAGRAERTLVRFNAFERFVHWMTAVSFVVLTVTGLNFTFGKELLLPYLGSDVFTAWSIVAKHTHLYLAVPFTFGVALMGLMWLPWAFPSRVDGAWFARGGGIVGLAHPPAHRFNAGQKLMFWIVVLGGGAIAASGYLLMVPLSAIDIADVQTAQLVHVVGGVLFVALMITHIYIGTLGMEGAFEAMGDGSVDVNFAKQHHSLWFDKQIAKGRPISDRDAQPAE